MPTLYARTDNILGDDGGVSVKGVAEQASCGLRNENPAVKIIGRQLVVDFDGDGIYEPYFIRGIGYNPYPVGVFPTEWGTCEYCKDQVPSGCFYSAAGGDGFACSAEPNGGPKHPWGGQPCGGFAPYPNACANLFDRGDVDLDRDFHMLVGMNANTIRTWEKVTPTLLRKADEYGIKVIAGYWIGHVTDFNNTDDLVDDFRNYIERMVGDQYFSSVLFVAIGNENNYYYYTPGEPPLPPPDPPGCYIAPGVDPEAHYMRAWYSLVNRLTEEAKTVAGMDRPVAVVNGEIAEIGRPDFYSDDSHLPSVDIWGVNVYRGISFGDLFSDFAARTEKPLWISECGADALYTHDFYDDEGPYYDPQNVSQLPQAQARWNAKQWGEIVGNAQVTIGATFMEYSDEWWKGRVDPGNYHWDQFVREHNSTGICHQYYPSSGVLPDSYFNEEWWGVMEVADGIDTGPGVDELVPRMAYYALCDSFACGIEPNVYYVGPYTNRSCDGTRACCANPAMYSRNGNCVSRCWYDGKYLLFEQAPFPEF